MKRFGSACALGLLGACFGGAACAGASEVVFLLEDPDRDETFRVSVRVGGGSFGLATYNVALSGLDASPLDPSTFVWEENTLSNLGVDFVTRGFTTGLLAGAIGSDGYSAANSQFQTSAALFGVGQTPVFVEAFDLAPDNFAIDLGQTAHLGDLTIPGANGISIPELEALLTPNAALFSVDGDAGVVGPPTSVSAFVVGLQKFTSVPPPDPLDPPLPTPAAVVVDFNGAGDATSADGPYAEQGVTMSLTPHPVDGGLGAFHTNGFGFDGTAAAVVDGASAAVTFAAGGAPFTLHGLDLPPELFAPDDLFDLSILTSGGHTQPLIAGGRTDFAGREFTGLTSFTLTKNLGSDPLVVDNLVITLLPEPATVVLVGFVAFGWPRPSTRSRC